MADRALKVGLILPMFSGDPGKVLGAARSAEDLGFDGVFAFDHLFPPGGPPDRPSLEAFTTLGAVAASTNRVALGTLVTRAILRPVGMTAKLAATIDLISGGRMILGVGTGDPIDRGEHEAFGFPDLSVGDRRAHLEESVRAWKALFEGRPFEGGSHVPRMVGPLLPGPIRPGGPPVWIGGHADAMVRMAGRLADGWNGWGVEPDAFRGKARLLADEAERAGRRSVEATWAGIVLVAGTEDVAQARLDERLQRGMGPADWVGSADRFAAFLRELAASGATWAVLVLAGPGGGRELLAERVLPTLT